MTPQSPAEKPQSRGRVGAGITLVIIGALLAALAVPAIWVNRTLISTDGWLNAVGPLASNPVVQNTLATQASDRVLTAVDVPGFVRSHLPTVAVPFAAPISDALEGAVRTQANNFTHSDAFPKVWIGMNRIAHTAVIAAVTERQGGAISNQAGVVSLHILPLVQQIQQQLVAKGFSAAARIPTARLDKTVVLFSSPELARATRIVGVLQAASIWLPVLALLCFAGALLVWPDRRRAVLWIGLGLVIATLVSLVMVRLGKLPVQNAVAASASPAMSSVAGIAYDTVLRDLFLAERTVAAFGLAIWFGAVLAGPAAWAVSIRSRAKTEIGEQAQGYDFGGFGDWVEHNKTTLRGAGFLAVVALFLVPGAVSPGGAIILVSLLAVWLAGIEFFGVHHPHPMSPA